MSFSLNRGDIFNYLTNAEKIDDSDFVIDSHGRPNKGHKL
jgi:hypothetical protein